MLAALARFDSVAAIAGELHLSVNTVKTHKRSLYRKLGVRSRAEAIEHLESVTVDDEVTPGVTGRVSQG